MWARVVEIMTATWLMISPFVFRVQDNPYLLWGDLATAFMIWVLAGLSYWHPTRHAHWFILLVAAGLILVGRFVTPPPASAAQQNHIFVGFFLLLIAIIPNHASQPPSGWRSKVSHE